jgi:putative phosphoesterase
MPSDVPGEQDQAASRPRRPVDERPRSTRDEAPPADRARVWRVGVVSDTHGRLEDRVLDLFEGVDRIVHAGDVGDERVLARLALVAPVTAVSGNMDAGLPTADLPAEVDLDVGGVRVLVGHVREGLLRHRDPGREGFAVVVTGHTHRAVIRNEDGVLFVNSGTANQAMAFGRPATVALLEIDRGQVHAEIVPL